MNDEPIVAPPALADARMYRWFLDRGIAPSVVDAQGADQLLRVLALTDVTFED